MWMSRRAAIAGAIWVGGSACRSTAALPAPSAGTPADTVVERATATRPVRAADAVVGGDDAASYEGMNARGTPNYSTRTLPAEDAEVLLRAYGITDPHRLYVSDSTEEGVLKYDTQVKRCATCYVNTYRVGYVSVRRPGETWEHAERRVETTPPREFLDGAAAATTALSTLDPDVAPLAEAMLRDARRAGFSIHVTATYRSPLREAYLMAVGGGRTHTLTSNHSYGRALDVVVGDGRLARAQTRQEWIAFRAWVIRYRTPAGESFRILGNADRSWDWPHVELPSAHLGFRTIDEALLRGRACLAPASKVSCNFAPHLGMSLQPLVQ
jgi:hypothetical protein